MHIRERLIRQLANGRFHSGTRLAQQLGVSRTAIWKQLQRIRQIYGLDVQAVRGRGYRLTPALELLDEREILRQLAPQTRTAISRLAIHQQLDSTNSWTMRRAKAGAASGLTCLAEQQLAGRGRHGRRWISPFGSNVYLSVLWHFTLAPAELSGLSLAMGLGVVRSLERAGVPGAGLKWPNDVMWRGRKLGGLLLEVTGEVSGPSQVVIGVGVNTRLPGDQAMQIEQPWIDLAGIPGGAEVSRNKLTALLLDQLVPLLQLFESDGLAPLVDEWNRRDVNLGRQVLLCSGPNRTYGVHRGVDANGALLLETGDSVKPFLAGELSLRMPGRDVGGPADRHW